MLSYDEQRHFADHGWVLLEGVLDRERCSAFVEAIDHFAETRRASDPSAAVSPLSEVTYVDNLILYDDIFLQWLSLPGILDANRQLLGARLHLAHSHAHVKRPHEDRQTRADELADHDRAGWHRELRPKWGTVAHDGDPGLVNCTYLNNITYLTAVKPGDGGTAVLDGSHRLEGTYGSLKDRCPVVEVTASAGSVLIFTESLLHSAMPILSENVRYNMYYGFVPPWFQAWPGFDVPTAIADALADDELRELLRPVFYHGTELPDASAVPTAAST